MFEDITPESIKAGIMAGLDTDLDTREGGFLNDMLGPVATELWKCYRAMNALLPVVYVDESSGSYIDTAAARYAITRKSGTKAAASVAFAGKSGTVIPAGTAFATKGGLEFTLDAAVTLAGGSGAGTLTADEAGESHNVEAGAVVSIAVAVSGLTSFAVGAASGGTDGETDEALVTRLYARLQTPATSGNAYHYRQWAMEVSGVGDAKVLPLWDGPGTVKVLLANGEKKPVDAAVATACAEHIAGEAPIGAAVTVESAEALEIGVAATITIDGTTTLEDVREALEASLGAYLQSIAFAGYTLSYNRVAYLLLDISGVTDYTALTVNGGTGSVTIEEHQVPVLGEVAIT